MLDAFKNITGGKGKLVQQQTTELETLIATAREERSALSAMLTSLTTRSAKLTPLSKSLEQVTDRATAVTARLDDIAKRLTALDDHTRESTVDKPSTP
jgi:septal ring factor EnvC (AmiA/AmiB activator)